MIIIKHKHTRPETIEKQYPGAVIVDVTSASASEYVKFSPFYPHRGIPVPFSPEWKATCVEAIWQGLKVFETAGIDTSLFFNDSMKGLKRSVRKFGPMKGHRRGVNGSPHRLLDYITARKLIYLPAYRWVLENKLADLVGRLRELSAQKTVVLLDYSTNPDVLDPGKPLSHAALIKAYIEGNYPEFRADDTPGALREGQWVVHDSLGPGRVVSIEGDKADVRFAGVSKTFDQFGSALKPVTADAPYLRTESSNGETATLCMDENGLWGALENPLKKQSAIPCEYEEIHFYAARLVARQKMPTYYFLVKQNGLWGLLNKQGRHQTPCIYDELSPRETDGLFTGFFFRRPGLSGLVDGKGLEQ
jgi:hypothetical protein